MPANTNVLEAVAQLLEQTMLQAERDGKPFVWDPAFAVRKAIEEITELRAKVFPPPGVKDMPTSAYLPEQEEPFNWHQPVATDDGKE